MTDRSSPHTRVPHGDWSATRYARGCRCVRCTEAHRQRSIRGRAARYAEREWRVIGGVLHLVAVREGLEHGKVSTNRNWGCKCPACYEAHLASLRHYNALRAAKKRKEKVT